LSETADIQKAKEVLAAARTSATAITRDLAGVTVRDAEAIEDIRLRLRRINRALLPLGQPVKP
jgi:hypothetical protein